MLKDGSQIIKRNGRCFYGHCLHYSVEREEMLHREFFFLTTLHTLRALTIYAKFPIIFVNLSNGFVDLNRTQVDKIKESLKAGVQAPAIDVLYYFSWASSNLV